ncbi:hypothetical protein MHA02_35950 [Methylobacterium haplocladii]|uniref:Uncharacterized protein n=1 Tax=Methylobacterium haplocladii TaxID=1176176 RepID=A0A512IU30_9HYPH|nr:hypothetical protein MHA02_35950 [Methylobacterium haplocladii]
MPGITQFSSLFDSVTSLSSAAAAMLDAAMGANATTANRETELKSLLILRLLACPPRLSTSRPCVAISLTERKHTSIDLRRYGLIYKT